jgi:NADPH:quinone reductase-like Zn-dependent oxidoreductase
LNFGIDGKLANTHIDHALCAYLQLRTGETVLVTGAAGGVGSAMVQVADKYGCTVIGVTSDEAKVDYIRALGASDVIVIKARGDSFHKEVLKRTFFLIFF